MIVQTASEAVKAVLGDRESGKAPFPKEVADQFKEIEAVYAKTTSMIQSYDKLQKKQKTQVLSYLKDQ